MTLTGKFRAPGQSFFRHRFRKALIQARAVHADTAPLGPVFRPGRDSGEQKKTKRKETLHEVDTIGSGQPLQSSKSPDGRSDQKRWGQKNLHESY